MGLARYMIVAQGDEWGVLHDGNISNRYATKEAAFEAAVAAASLAIREGHEVRVVLPLDRPEIKRHSARSPEQALRLRRTRSEDCPPGHRLSCL